MLSSATTTVAVVHLIVHQEHSGYGNFSFIFEIMLMIRKAYISYSKAECYDYLQRISGSNTRLLFMWLRSSDGYLTNM